MKKMISAAVAATVMVSLVASQATAQNAAGVNAKKYGIAVVDIAYIFKQHNTFRAMMDGMKQDMKGIEQMLEGDRKKILAADERKNSFKPGSPEFSNADDKVAEMKAQFQLKMQKMRKEFMEKEGKAYQETYTQVSQAIDYYAKNNGIGLVVRFDGEKPDPASREGILKDINKQVQFQNQIDITPEILALVNRGTQRRPAASAPAVGARPGVGASRR